MLKAGIFMGLVYLYLGVTWIINLVQLVNCDFSSTTSWKPEIIHGIGLIFPCNGITVWL